MIDQLKEIFARHDPEMKNALQGAEARIMCRPDHGDYSIYRPDPDFADVTLPLKAAAVLIPLIDRPEGLTILLTKRADHLKSHAGQVSFPGGRCDPVDKTAQDTALREAHEEVGIDPGFVRVIGAMEDYETVTGFTVTPVVGIVSPDFTLSPDAGEVADVFELPLEFFLDEKNHAIQSRVWKGRKRYYYVYENDQYNIWGATAAMLVRFAKLVNEGLT